MKRFLCIALSLIFVSVLLGGCLMPKEENSEIGNWHGEIKLSDLTDSMAEEYQFLLTLIAGSVAFDVDVSFYEDGTFEYSMNTDDIKDSISSSVSTVAGWFIDQDISSFTNRVVDAVVEEFLLGSDTHCSGTYTVVGDIITANGDDHTVLQFELKDNYLYQLDENGESILRFSKVND